MIGRRTLVVASAVVAASLTVIGVAPVGSATPDETKLTASDGALDDFYGYSVAVGADGTVAVGSRFDDDDGDASGSAYVYVPNGSGGFTEVKLNGSASEPGDHFGTSVAVGPDGTVAVGARFADTGEIADTGAVYLYEPTGGGGYNETGLAPSDPSVDQSFGRSLAIGPDGTIAVGAPGPFGSVIDGSVYVYSPDGVGGYTETKLTASDGVAGDEFGYSVAVAGDGTIVVGAWQDDDSGDASGSVYVYAPGTFVETKLTASDGVTNDFFGFSVAIDDDGVIAVGAMADDDNGAQSGSVYLFTPDGLGGYVESKLLASDGAIGDQFGYSVSYGPDSSLAVGAWLDDDDGLTSGAAYVYALGGGFDQPIESKLTAGDAEAGDAFGFAVAVGDDATLAVSAFNGDRPGVDGTGAVYLYDLRCNGVPVSVDLAAGDSPTAGDDVILGTDGDDTIDALAGDDVVCAGDGDDSVVGGDGDDTVVGEGGADNVIGGAGADTLLGGDGVDVLSGNAGDDVLSGGAEGDTIFGGSGNDQIAGGDGDDLLGGGSDVDTISGEAGADRISGGSGADGVISGGDGNDAVNGGGDDDAQVFGDAGDDTVSGNGGKDVVDGGAGNDEVRGGQNDDTVNGGPGDDLVAGNAGVDVCDGGTTDETAGDTAAANCETVLNVP
jgi:Ca2+-binding RTX toxin-like protein